MISLETDRLTIRNFAPDDWRALQEVVVAYQASDLARFEDPWPTADEKVKEIDINPFKVFSKGGLALDMRIIL